VTGVSLRRSKDWEEGVGAGLGCEGRGALVGGRRWDKDWEEGVGAGLGGGERRFGAGAALG